MQHVQFNRLYIRYVMGNSELTKLELDCFNLINGFR